MRNSAIRYATSAAAVMLCSAAILAQTTPPTPTPQAFVNKATIANLAEVELGKVAEDRAMTSDVKTFAHQMVADHTAAQAHLETAAKEGHFKVPIELDQMHKDVLKELKTKTGVAFDRFYMETMAKGHHDVFTYLKDASATLTNEGLKRWTLATLPTVEAHMKDADRIVRTLTPTKSN